jgi:nickel-dependent lactate racemase
MFGENIVSAYKFINHTCDSPHLKDLGNLKNSNKLWDNPLHEEIREAAEKVGVGFNINVVTNEHHEIIEEDIIINIGKFL